MGAEKTSENTNNPTGPQKDGEYGDSRRQQDQSNADQAKPMGEDTGSEKSKQMPK